MTERHMETDPSYVCTVNLSDADDDIDEPQIIHEELKHDIKEPKTDQVEALPVSSASSVTFLRPLIPKPIAPSCTSDINPKVHNVVASVDLGCKLDLTKIALAVRNADYNPKRFRAIIMRIHDPRTVILIFGSGKIVITGAKSEAAAILSARKCARIVQKLGNNVKFINFKVQNMVASCDVRFPIHIESIYRNHSQFCSYEPELFPGLIYRMVKPKVVLLIFVTGKMVLTGVKTREDLHNACEYIYPVLRNFRKQ